LTVGIAAIASGVVVIIAGLARIDGAIATGSEGDILTEGVADSAVRGLALFDTDLNKAITTARQWAVTEAVVGVYGVAIVAVFGGPVVINAITTNLKLTDRVAAIAAEVITIITGLTCFKGAVTAVELNGAVTAIACGEIAIVTLFSFIKATIATSDLKAEGQEVIIAVVLAD
jgi:hypothetical protein